MGIVIIGKKSKKKSPVDMKYGVRELERETVMAYQTNILKIDTLKIFTLNIENKIQMISRTLF